MRVAKSKWFVPLFAVALGLVVFAAQWIGGVTYIAAVIVFTIRG